MKSKKNLLDIVNKIKLNERRIFNAISNFVERRKQYVEKLKASKLEKVPLDMINKYRLEIDSSIKESYNTIRFKIERNKSKLSQNISKLDALSPLKTLTRGYSVVENELGQVIKSKKDIKSKDKLNVILNDGKINVVAE